MAAGKGIGATPGAKSSRLPQRYVHLSKEHLQVGMQVFAADFFHKSFTVDQIQRLETRKKKRQT